MYIYTLIFFSSPGFSFHKIWIIIFLVNHLRLLKAMNKITVQSSLACMALLLHGLGSHTADSSSGINWARAKDSPEYCGHMFGGCLELFAIHIVPAPLMHILQSDLALKRALPLHTGIQRENS